MIIGVGTTIPFDLSPLGLLVPSKNDQHKWS
nr:MAG TPA: hypothetical protein [Caudoviricetes sp.]